MIQYVDVNFAMTGARPVKNLIHFSIVQSARNFSSTGFDVKILAVGMPHSWGQHSGYNL